MLTEVKMTGSYQIFRTALCLVFLMFVVWPASGQELKQVSPTLAAKIAESGRKRVAVVDFTDLQGNVTELGRYLAEELSGALVNDSRGFRVIDRAHLKAILQEHKLAATGLIDPQTARQLGKIASVDTLVTGTITSAFGETVRVLVKALDVETADIIAQTTADMPKTDAIKILLGQGIATDISAPGRSNEGPAPQPPTEPKPGAVAKAVAVEENNLLFILKICRRSGRTISCAGSITSKADNSTGISVGVNWGLMGIYTDAVDDLGNRYNISLRTSNFNLEPNLPINFSLEIDGVAPEASRINIVLGYTAGERRGKVLLRNVPIQQSPAAAPAKP